MDPQTKALAQVIWDYHHMNHSLVHADAILVLCSHDLVVAERGAELFLEGWAPLLIFSGGLGTITSQMWTEPEADRFAALAMRWGVPPEKILIENKSTNTGENILFTRKLLKDQSISPNSLILVQKPYMERRTFATCKKFWPEVEIAVTSPQLTFDQYLDQHSNRQLSNDDVVSIMVGDLQRIRDYPAKGFQIHQEIPAEVWQAYESLVAAGYDKHLSK
ncbi:MAG TPA: YdcF family protein [Pyrinomonadaceae bacterium]|nr:YdcF family protein [Pyrinomonadaceae bacterium]